MKQEEKSMLSRKKILEAAGVLFTQKGFDATTMQDITTESGLSKGAIYHHFKSKEEIMAALLDKMFLENNPFYAVKERNDLNGLQKMKMAMKLNQSDNERTEFSKQAISILKNPHVLSGIIDSNRRILTPLWLELIEEGNNDGSIHTRYAKELSELIPLFDLWLMPSIYPASTDETCHKFVFIKELLDYAGLPLIDNEMMEMIKQSLSDLNNTN